MLFNRRYKLPTEYVLAGAPSTTLTPTGVEGVVIYTITSRPIYITFPHCLTTVIACPVGMEKKRFLGNLYIRIGKKITTQSEKTLDTNRLRFRGTLFRYIYNTLAKGSYKPFYI